MSKFLSAENQYFGKISLFSPLNALIFPSPEPQTTDFQLEINVRHALKEYDNIIKGGGRNIEYNVCAQDLSTSMF